MSVFNHPFKVFFFWREVQLMAVVFTFVFLCESIEVIMSRVTVLIVVIDLS